LERLNKKMTSAGAEFELLMQVEAVDVIAKLNGVIVIDMAAEEGKVICHSFGNPNSAVWDEMDEMTLHKVVNSGAYETAAGSCYTIFRCLAKTCKEHEDWFACKKRKMLFDEKSGADNFIKYNQGGILEENFLYAIASKTEELVAVPK